ncbi:DMT family transporter [Pleurocapsa sp. FMAR1]|uniref:DMT family transporter n=1 Tax=Pleurocapsa sp. FMAR1 TaxID=3040204 RepID=UPI0029C8E824|nr:DMT family transporter [Pleurocapsa sp. FMAR1]
MNKNSLLIPDNQTEQISARDLSSGEKIIASSISLGILFIAIVALAFSPIFTKLSEIELLTPTAIVFNRLWIATIIISCWQIIKTPPEFKQIQFLDNIPNYKERSLLILASVAATVSSLLWAMSLTQTSVASSTVLRSLTPLFISLGAWLILKQQFNRQFVTGMAISIAGGMIIGWDDLQLGTEYLSGDSLALLSAALHGVNLLTVGYLRDRDCNTAKVLFWRCGFGALIILPIVYLTDTPMFPTSTQGWLTVIALAVICQTFGQGLLVYSLKQFSSSFVGIFTLLKPIITAFLAWVIFAENLNLTSCIAVILILCGIYLAKSSNSAIN